MERERLAALEAAADCLARAWPLWKTITTTDAEAIAIVAHAGVNRLLLCRLLGMPVQNMFRLGQDYGCVNILELDRRAVKDSNEAVKLSEEIKGPKVMVLVWRQGFPKSAGLGMVGLLLVGAALAGAGRFDEAIPHYHKSLENNPDNPDAYHWWEPLLDENGDPILDDNDRGTLQLRAMLSPDPLMGKSGYPLLLAAGETADGVEPLPCVGRRPQRGAARSMRGRCRGGHSGRPLRAGRPRERRVRPERDDRRHRHHPRPRHGGRRHAVGRVAAAPQNAPRPP
jgi:tetratricopeptide (TPR) repeat protein